MRPRAAIRVAIAGVGRAALTVASPQGDLLPLEVVQRVRRVLPGQDPFIAGWRPVDGSTIANPDLARILEGLELGAWALGPKSLILIFELAHQLQPHLIVEFGSGASTIVLARVLAERPDRDDLVVSIEQDQGFAEKTRDLLRTHGLDRYARVIHAPLERRRIEGRPRTVYGVPEEAMAIFAARQPELIVIDGPAAETGGRFATLPLLHPFVHRAAFVMDDALRDSELATASEWQLLPYITLDGIRPVEKGLLYGQIAG